MYINILNSQGSTDITRSYLRRQRSGTVTIVDKLLQIQVSFGLFPE